jgi:hypothetical protein
MSTQPIEHQHTSAGRVIRLNMGLHEFAPVDPIVATTGGPVVSASPTEPDIVTSPLRADGLVPTSGVMFLFKELVGAGSDGSAEPNDPSGFLVTVWVRNPVNSQWGNTDPLRVPFNQWIRTFDFNGGDIYFQITDFDDADNFLDVHVVEL